MRSGGHEPAEVPGLSVVMPSHRQAHCLEPVLAALADQTLAAEAFEVVVVEDPSEVCYRRAAELAAKYGFRFDTMPRHSGRSATRNRALQLARGEVLLFLDSDCYPAPDLLERHWRCHQAQPAARVVLGTRLEIGSLAMAGRLLRGRAPRFPDPDVLCYDQRFPDEWPQAEARIAMQTPWLFTYTNVSAPRELVTAVGGFDEQFGTQWGLEDVDLFYRIYRHLGRQPDAFVYDGSLIAYHLPHHRDSPRELSEARGNEPYFRRKHPHFETEFNVDFPLLSALKIRQYRQWVEQLVAAGAGQLPEPAWQRVAQVLAEWDAPRVLYAGQQTDRLPLPPGTTTVDHGRPESAPGNHHLLGLATGYPDGAFDVVVNVDLWQVLRWEDFCKHVLEALRIAQELVLVASEGYAAGAARVEGGASADLRDLDYLEQALRPHATVTVDRGGAGAVLLRIRPPGD